MLQKLTRYKIVNATFGLCALFVLGGWLWAFAALRGISQPLIIHFTSVSGINQIGGLRDLANIGLLGGVIILVNFYIALRIEERDRFLGKFLAAGTVFISILIFIGFAAIIGV